MNTNMHEKSESGTQYRQLSNLKEFVMWYLEGLHFVEICCCSELLFLCFKAFLCY